MRASEPGTTATKALSHRTRSLRFRLILVAWMTAFAVTLGRSAQLQVVEVADWREAARAQHQTSAQLAAPRGTIYDRDGVPLAESREVYTVAVASEQIRDRDAVRTALEEALGVSPAGAEKATEPDAGWTVLPGRFEASVREAIRGVHGIHYERLLERVYPRPELARGLLGTVLDGQGAGGIEQVYDELLQGRPGRQVLARDGDGRPIPGETLTVQAPVPGGDVRLTIDLDVQEIAHEALAEAIQSEGASGGDLVVADPVTGELLALVSIKDGRSNALSAVNAPYEPGSTLKPFTLTALLKHGLATLADTVDAENGRWIAPGGRPLSDVHGEGRITLADALRVSSNIGVAKAALALSPAQQYENLRDFGFGVETGIPLPGEVAGTLRLPERWTARSPVSLAIGYEISATPLQMAMAYGALANGGSLMKPILVSEARGPAGEVVERAEVRRIRQVATPEITRRIGEILVRVVEDGTGTAARMSTFLVAGKSGTSRSYVAGSGYGSGRYYSSFAGFFPADDPQLVVFVKLDLDDTEGGYYGGATAGPVTRSTMEAVLAARGAPIDRGALLRSSRPTPPAPRSGEARASGPTGPAESLRFAAVSLSGEATRDASPVAGVHLPDISELSPRAAARRLHALGLRVTWLEGGRRGDTRPGVGEPVTPGDTVVVFAGGGPPAGRRKGGGR